MYYHPAAVKTETSPNRTPPNFWTTAEVSVGLIAACLPPLGPLIRKAPSLKYYTSKLSSLYARTSHSRSVTKFTNRFSITENGAKAEGFGRLSEETQRGYEMGKVHKADTSLPTTEASHVGRTDFGRPAEDPERGLEMGEHRKPENHQGFNFDVVV